MILCWNPLFYSEKRAEQSIFQYTHAHGKKNYRSKSPICFAVRGFVVCYLECLDYYEIFVCFGISFGSHQKSNANEISTPNINEMVREYKELIERRGKNWWAFMPKPFVR